MHQPSLFSEFDIPTKNKFPSTRYQGSKAKFVDWIWKEISGIPFHTALDAFGGTGSVAYKLKDNGKCVTYNDILPFNSIIGKAIIENSSTILSDADINYILTEKSRIKYPTFIADNFGDIYFTDAENHWLDVVRYNISTLDDEYKKAIAWFALFQSCIIKRPYNLFHRKIYMCVLWMLSAHLVIKLHGTLLSKYISELLWKKQTKQFLIMGHSVMS